VFRRALVAIVAFVLLSSGLIHIAQPYFFIFSVASYQVIPDGLLGIWVINIPYLQVVLALCLFLGVAERVSAVLAGALFFIFSVAQAIVLLRGESLNCGCFGYSSSQVGAFSLAIPILCTIICIALLLSWNHDAVAIDNKQSSRVS